MTEERRMSLRERKRLAAMRRIQTMALDLFDAHGFDSVTVEQIADAAEVSASSVYRYFGTKERIVIWDEFDDRAMAGIAAELHRQPPLEAIRSVVEVVVVQALATDVERVHRRMRIAFANPTVEAASVQETYAVAGIIAGLLMQRGGLGALDAQVLAHGFAGGLLGGLRHWHDSDFTTPMEEVVDRALAILAAGLEPSD